MAIGAIMATIVTALTIIAIIEHNTLITTEMVILIMFVIGIMIIMLIVRLLLLYICLAIGIALLALAHGIILSAQLALLAL